MAESVFGFLKAVLEHCPPLVSCDQLGCQCPGWHGLAGPHDPEPILELWGRNFATLQFKPCAAAEAEVFSVFVRVPASLQVPLLRFSGSDGVFFEPRDGASKRADPNFSVVWMPRSSVQELVLHRQTQEHVIGIARTGLRLGVRCFRDKEEQLHGSLRPSVPFLGTHADRIYHAGPLPYGAQRQAIAKTLKHFAWSAKPLHTVPGGSGEGLWWAIQAAEDPPFKVIHCDHGEVLISGPVSKPDRPTASHTVVAAKATLRTLAAQANPLHPQADPLQKNDPWGKWLEENGRARKVPSQVVPASEPPRVPV